ncbi:MAG TPA: hypothetical protein VEI06_00725 [Gemmatimonadaceae bacterium]|nr:hypothetical protein [Gemmatimonadaceae bacterium]
MSLSFRPSDGTPATGPFRGPVGVPEGMPPSPTEERDDAAVVDFAAVRDVLLFPVHAVRRWPRVAKSVFAAMAVLTLLVAVLLPRHYVVETKILAERNEQMSALSNPRRSAALDADEPTRMATEAVMSRDNLVALIRQANLLVVWPEIRPAAGQMREAVAELFRGPLPDSERIDGLVQVLERRMWTNAGDGTVTIGIDWPDPVSGKQIVSLAQQNFLERRHASETTLIGETISILEHHVDSARLLVEQALVDAGRAEASSGNAISPRTERIVALQGALAGKLAAIADLQAQRRQRLSALQEHLAELKNTYGSAHPDVAATEETIRVLSFDSPQLSALRIEERQIRSQLAALGDKSVSATDPSPNDPATARAMLERLTGRAGSDEDPRTTYAKSRLSLAVSNYEDLLDRLESARIELETTKAAFKYRYGVVMPPRLPTGPVKPNVPLVLVGGLLLSAALALFAATVLDLGSGRVLESWQVSRHLRLRVLGQVPRQ